MHALIVPYGSHGDVHPLIGLGHALRGRGHRVTFLIHEFFGPLIRGLGFEMVPVCAEMDFQAILRDPDMWHPTRGINVVSRSLISGARGIFEAIRGRYEPGETVVVGGSLAVGTRIAQEALGVPTATVHLQPGTMHSNHLTPIYGGKDTNGWPRWLRRRFFDLVYLKYMDPKVAPGLNLVRAEARLPPVRDVFRTYLSSPDLTLGFFPGWFGPPQPDWPAMELVGFPLYDEADATPLPADLDAFLDAGPPPIAFTPGSANVQGRPFFDASADACRRLGRRGLLLTRFPEQIPRALPDGVIHVPYAPFSRLLPRVAALVHHGGVGTSAQGMAAGVPQLVMPLAYDQFDNASRMGKLGVARSILPKAFKGPRVAKTLATLLDDPGVAAACRSVAARFADDPRPMEVASGAIEALALSREVPRAASRA